ncbi:glycerol kinase [Streptococcus mutans]|uniref:glycerol kinase n=1 Tax=Streptococcus mutans TaxID=1309 RepID=UPI0014558AC5|nr:glycerol kinase [Streptococcus mutans]NLQ75296.1 glycerol kinase [Streptococcus mutans]
MGCSSFQADVLQILIEQADNFETTVIGVAFLAVLAVGYWQDTAELQELFTTDQRFEPSSLKSI